MLICNKAANIIFFLSFFFYMCLLKWLQYCDCCGISSLASIFKINGTYQVAVKNQKQLCPSSTRFPLWKTSEASAWDATLIFFSFSVEFSLIDCNWWRNSKSTQRAHTEERTMACLVRVFSVVESSSFILPPNKSPTHLLFPLYTALTYITMTYDSYVTRHKLVSYKRWQIKKKKARLIITGRHNDLICHFLETW